MAYASLLKTGSVATTSGSRVVTGTGTAWVSDNVLPGAEITIVGESLPFVVEEVTSETSLKIDTPASATLTGAAYAIRRFAYDTPLASLLARLLAQQAQAFDLDGGDKSITLATDTGEVWHAFSAGSLSPANRFRIGTDDLDTLRIQRWDGAAWADVVTIDRSTGVAAVSTASSSTSSTRVATTAFVHAVVGAESDALAADIAGLTSTVSAHTTALGERLRVDAAQSLSAGEKTQARSNLGLGTAAPLDAGTGANDLVQRGSGGAYPAGNGAAITSVPWTVPAIDGVKDQQTTVVAAATIGSKTTKGSTAAARVFGGSGPGVWRLRHIKNTKGLLASTTVYQCNIERIG